MGSIESIINRQLLKWEMDRNRSDEEKISIPSPPRVVTVSRQAGSRGAYFASRLAEELGFQRLHREAIDAICASSGFRKRIVESLDEKFRGDLELLAESLFTGSSVDHRDYYRHLFRVVLSMARLGGVVLIGRGGNFILGPLRGFHIRVVAPKEQRIANLMKYSQLSDVEAATELTQTDIERRGLISKLFDCDIDDPQQYDLVINLAFINLEEMIEPTVTAIRSKFRRLA
ncbi:MAG: cytidylate kinase-like family protein, partial [candidate division Zixibacteria bacterium]|nr:cytidylate kinase-like family protein [candidate division Zixibacteria bacterium]